MAEKSIGVETSIRCYGNVAGSNNSPAARTWYHRLDPTYFTSYIQHCIPAPSRTQVLSKN